MKTKIPSRGRSNPSFDLDFCFPGLLQPHRFSRGALQSHGLNNLGHKIGAICGFSTNKPAYCMASSVSGQHESNSTL